MSPIESLRDKARQWASDVVEFYNTPVPPELEAEKNSILKYAKFVKESIEKVFGTLDELREIPTEGLGAIPILVPGAVIAAAAAAIATYYYKVAAFNKRLNAYLDLTNGGLTHSQAINVIGEPSKSIFPSIDINKLLVPVVGIGALFYFLRSK